MNTQIETFKVSTPLQRLTNRLGKILLNIWISSLITLLIMGLSTIIYEFAVNGITANFGIY